MRCFNMGNKSEGRVKMNLRFLTWLKGDMVISTTDMENEELESFEAKENEFCFGKFDSQLEMKG